MVAMMIAFIFIWTVYMMWIVVYMWCLFAMVWMMFDNAYFKYYEQRQIIDQRKKLKQSFKVIQGNKSSL